MASPAEIVERHDRLEVLKIIKKVVDNGDPEPDGFIRVNGKMRPVWLPPGQTPESLGLKTFSPTRRWA